MIVPPLREPLLDPDLHQLPSDYLDPDGTA
jgi:hypothetical protein